jgi:outer membrane protein OmpA-like peptidoglycan-associated protein
MNTFLPPRKSLIAVAVACALLAAAVLAGCTAAPTKPDGADSLRSRLTQLQSNPELASRAPLAIKDAEVAVTAAEMPQADKAVGAHLVFMADRKLGIAEAQAETHLAVAQRKTLGEEREAMRLDARTEEADSANRRADAARDATADSQRNAQELQRQIDELQAKVTDRGLVLTLGDVLFATGTAELNTGGTTHLGKLAGFLNQYPERTAVIEGHTDSIGSDEYNHGLSQRRADAVKAFLMGQGVGSTRLTAFGKGEGSPIGDNGSATGRQQNRRVEVIIQNLLVSSR